MFAYKNNRIILISTTTVVLFFVFMLKMAEAAGYVPLAPLPGISPDTGVSLGKYLDTMFKIGIGLAGVFAVLMIIIGGVQFIGGASSPSARTDAKERITNAIFGLILALSSWLILQTINPAILKTGLDVKSIEPTATPTASWFFDWRYKTDPVGFVRGKSGPFSSASECDTQTTKIGTEIISSGCVSE